MSYHTTGSRAIFRWSLFRRSLFWPSMVRVRVRQTDRRTDGRSDGRTDIFRQHSPRCRPMEPEFSVRLASVVIATVGILTRNPHNGLLSTRTCSPDSDIWEYCTCKCIEWIVEQTRPLTQTVCLRRSIFPLEDTTDCCIAQRHASAFCLDVAQRLYNSAIGSLQKTDFFVSDFCLKCLWELHVDESLTRRSY